MVLHNFLEEMCDEIRYKPIHKELREEIKAHIEEAAEEYIAFGYDRNTALNIAAARIGNAREIGEMLNKEYRMPFNNRRGLAIWAAIVTAIVYAFYPIIYKINNNTINLRGYNGITVAAIIILFALCNFMYLRRGRMMITVRDMLWITVGFLSGWLVSIATLLLTARFTGHSMYYPYFPDVKIPFAPMYLPLLPKHFIVFGVEYFCWWFCLMVYMGAAKSRRKIKPFSFVVNVFDIQTGYMVDDENFIEWKTPDGSKPRDAFLAFIGMWVDKFGERTGIRREEDYY